MPISFTRATWTDYVGPPFMQASEVNRLETAIDALINGSSRAVYRDGDTITGNLTVNGWIEADQGFRDAGGVTRISATGAGVFSQATVSDVPDTRVMFATTAGRVTSDASFLYIVGTGRIQAGGRVGFSSTLNFRRAGDGAAVHFETGNTGTNAFIPDTTTTGNNPFLGTTNFRWQGIYGGLIDSSGSVNAATSLQTSGVTRISSTGAGTLASVTAADLTANLPVYADASKKLATESASAFRSRIGAAATTDLASYQPLDSDLTAIASLTTTSFGRSLLTQADAAAARATIGAGVDLGYTPISKDNDTNAVMLWSVAGTSDTGIGWGGDELYAAYGDCILQNRSTQKSRWVHLVDGAVGFGPASWPSDNNRYQMAYDAGGGVRLTTRSTPGVPSAPFFDCVGGFRVNGSAVVGTRKTGWAAATGTATRTTFATGSVTTAQLAERVKALIDDLISHGLIGA
jgi:hypothetical protein